MEWLIVIGFFVLVFGITKYKKSKKTGGTGGDTGDIPTTKPRNRPS